MQEAEKLNQDLDNVLAEARAHAAEMVAINAEIKEPSEYDAWKHIKATPGKVFSGLIESLGKIYDGLMNLPGQVKEGISPHKDEMWEGIEFGFKAAGVVLSETARFMYLEYKQRAIEMVGTYALGKVTGTLIKLSRLSIPLKYIPAIEKSTDFTAGRLLAMDKLDRKYNNLENYLNLVTNTDKKIRRLLNKDDFYPHCIPQK